MAVTVETASKKDNLGLNLYCTVYADGAGKIQLNSALIPSNAPGDMLGSSYLYLDSVNLVPGATYYYWLEDVDMSGTLTMHGPVSARLAGAGDGNAQPSMSYVIFLPAIILDD